MPVLTPSGVASVEHAADRFAFLAAAGEALASSLDYEETLQRVARMAVPALGDMCAVDIIEGERIRRVAVSHVLPEKLGLMHRLAECFPPDPGSPAPAGRVLASGRTELLEAVDPAVVRRHTRSEEHATLILTLGIRSHLAVPMTVRGQMLGVISIGITESDRRYGPDDVAVAEEIARRAAMAIENARLYRAAREEIERRRAAEAELRLSESRYRAILEQSPMSTQILAPDGRTLQVNRAWEQLWGLTLDDVGGYNVLTDPQLQARGITPLLRRAFEGEPVQLPTIAYDPDATLPERSRNAAPLRWVSAMAYPVRDADGAVREVVLIHTDITEARVAQERLRESEHRLHRALSAAHMAVWDWDLRSGIIECSDNAIEFFGMQVAHADDFLRTIHPDDLARVREASAASLREGVPFAAEFRLASPDGRERWVHSRGEVDRDAHGEPVRFLGVTMDTTSLKHAEDLTRMLADAGRVLGASLDYTTTLADLSRVVVPRLADWYAVDLLTEDGRLERVSVHHPDPARVRLAHALFERYPPRRDAPAGAWRVIESGEPEWMADIPDSLLEQAAENAEHLAITRSLQLRSYIAVPLVARDAVIGVLTLVYAESGRRYRESDIDVAADLARRAAAAVDNARLFARLQAEHRRKDEFLATLAHELRNPLAPIRTGLAVLSSCADAVTSARVHGIMERQLAQMVRLIDDLLDLSRVTRGAIELRRERVGFDAIVSSALETSRPALDAAGVAVHVHPPAAPLWFDADPTRLSQLLTNLLANAAKFTPRGGRVDIRADATPDGARIEVADTGIGIEPARLSQVFEMFVRGPDSGAQGGLGIGLTLARRLAELHGGSLHAESDGPGTGSRFVLQLPLAGAPAETSATAARSAGTGRRRVLVVDDNVDAAETLALLLDMGGHEVRTAACGTEALDVALDLRPELAFLDIGLPDISGFELAGRLRAVPELAGIRLVALTGWGRDEDRQRACDAGFDAHLTKPVDAAAVLEQLARLDGG
ncbi:MAG: ATP-binding protein [Pseudomonadota bacterium]